MKLYELSVYDDIDICVHKTKKLEDFPIIAEIDKEIDISQVIRINGKTYSVWCKRADNSIAYVEKVDLSKSEDELYYEDEIICPNCKTAVLDSWECADYDNNFKCGKCGSIFSYERVVNPTYNMKLIKKGKVIEV